MRWYYFGCGRDVGHYIFRGQCRTLEDHSSFERYLERYDGRLAPLHGPPYIAALSRLGHIGFSAVSWYDKSVDTRPGSNSILFVEDMSFTIKEILARGEIKFPWVFSRLPQPLEVHDGKTFRTQPASPLKR